MLHLIPAPLHRALLRVAHRVRRRWRRWTKPQIAGVAVIAIDEAGRVFLVRHGYGSGRWSLPGGGLGRREDPQECAHREMREELGCALEHLELAAELDEVLYGAPHRAYVFTARFVGDPRPDGREIVEAGWFGLDALPPDLVSFAAYRLRLAFPDS
ncbi:MAG TPA: NUDIX domain-containing protein [Croceibacterium sp.]|nr:NUDIX domain-containing protein [Croceibacterium sp.]